VIDWWQALLLSVAGALVGGLITLAVSYATHRWTTDATREAEERASQRRLAEEDREATRRKEAEERQVRREWRRDQIKPVVEFLEKAKRYLAGQEMQQTAEAAWERNAAGIKDQVSLEDFRKYLAKDESFADIHVFDLAKAYHVAISTTPEMTQQLLGLFMAVTSAREPLEVGKQSAAIGALERVIEDYVTKV
jgi:hypothetical protein